MPEAWDKERWRQMLDFPNYWLSDYGRVINLKTGQMISVITRNGGRYVKLYSAYKTTMVTRAINTLMRRIFPNG